MAQDFLKIENEVGVTALSKPVFESIVKNTLEEAKGIIFDKTDSSIYQCKFINNDLKILMNLTIKYGEEVTKTCEKLQMQIYDNIYDMTNIKCNDINIRISGFRF
jgi:uncharacterized alkaline shock family protein YloU